MKKYLLVFISLFIVSNILWAQSSSNYFQFSINGGFDKPMLNDNMPYIKYKGGLSTGISLNYYWRHFGVQTDFNYIKNKPAIDHISDPFKGQLKNGVVNMSLFSTRKDITRMFWGLGPAYKFETSNGKFSTELSLLGGIGFVKGGEIYAYGQGYDSLTLRTMPVTYHSGFNSKPFTLKGQLRANYFVTPSVFIQAGAYYIHHFNVKESQKNTMISTVASSNYITYYESTNVNDIFTFNTKALRGYDPTGKIAPPITFNYNSVGAFVGVGFRLFSNGDKRSKHNLEITAIDKISGEKIPNAFVTIKNTKGEVLYTGYTDNNGVFLMEKVSPVFYTIEGNIASAVLEGAVASEEEFKNTKTVKKTIYYASEDFIIEGRAFECSSNKGLKDVTVFLEDATGNFKQTTVTNTNGKFLLSLPKAGNYFLYGKKAKYFSQTEEVNTSNYDRKKSLFVKLNICADEIDCNKTFKLKSIHYDRDKYFIREDAKPELNKLIEFLKENPDLNVELGSHTDCRSDNAYNQTLSQNRAGAAKDYMVSKGIQVSRIKAIGYGETQLLNKCVDGVDCPETMHEINRRTEFKIICK